MFLAVKEIFYDKSRFALIIAVIALVGYLVYFLTALAFGLATSYTQGIEKWQASGIILSSKANNTIARSLIPLAELEQVTAPDKAPLGVSSTLVELEEAQDATIFGIDLNTFLAPETTEGRAPQNSREVIASDDLRTEGVELNDQIKLSQVDEPLTVVGFTDNATFQTSPIIYTSLEDWRQIASQVSGMTAMRDQTTINAIVVRGAPDQIGFNHDTLSWQTISDFSFKLPGYSAQVATFGLMIGALLLIAAFVLTIFIYILTLQKKSMFGILKAEGVPTSYIAKSVIAQTLILSIAGLAIGAMLAILTGWGLQGLVPFLVQPIFFLIIAAAFIICALLGGLVSVRAVAQIDPVQAIE